MSLLQNIKRNYPDELRTVEVGGKVVNFILGDSPYGDFIRQWEIDGNDETTVKLRYDEDRMVSCFVSEGLLGERPFNPTIKIEFLYNVIGWGDKALEALREANEEGAARVLQDRPNADPSKYDFTFSAERKLDRLLKALAWEQKKAKAAQ